MWDKKAKRENPIRSYTASNHATRETHWRSKPTQSREWGTEKNEKQLLKTRTDDQRFRKPKDEYSEAPR